MVLKGLIKFIALPKSKNGKNSHLKIFDILLKGRLKYNPNSRKITLILNNHLEAMTFYGDDFRNMLGLEKASDPGDLTI